MEICFPIHGTRALLKQRREKKMQDFSQFVTEKMPDYLQAKSKYDADFMLHAQTDLGIPNPLQEEDIADFCQHLKAGSRIPASAQEHYWCTIISQLRNFKIANVAAEFHNNYGNILTKMVCDKELPLWMRLQFVGLVAHKYGLTKAMEQYDTSKIVDSEDCAMCAHVLQKFDELSHFEVKPIENYVEHIFRQRKVEVSGRLYQEAVLRLITSAKRYIDWDLVKSKEHMIPFLQDLRRVDSVGSKTAQKGEI